MRSSFHGWCVVALVAAGCGGAETSASGGDAASDDVVTLDAGPDVDARPDAVAATDGASTDSARGEDGPITDALGADAATSDVTAPDAASLDVGSAVDSGAAIDGGPATRADVVEAGVVTDAGAVTDHGVVDVGGATDAGCGALPTLTALAPSPSEEIETCSASNRVVNYVFRASASGEVSNVRFNWRTPGGDLAPPTASASGASPFAVTRQVGGPTAAGAAPALAVFPNALRGTWTFEVDAVDRCGRAVSARRAFTLTYTNRSCPNP